MTNDADLKDRLSFAIFWAMWKRQVSPPRLGAAVGKSPDTIRRWRDGETAPSVLDVGPLAVALGVRPDFFTNPPDVPEYAFDSYLVEGAEPVGEPKQPRPGIVPSVEEVGLAVRVNPKGIEEGARRGQTHEPVNPPKPAPSPRRPVRAR